jgi:hypothetical protein
MLDTSSICNFGRTFRNARYIEHFAYRRLRRHLRAADTSRDACVHRPSTPDTSSARDLDASKAMLDVSSIAFEGRYPPVSRAAY